MMDRGFFVLSWYIEIFEYIFKFKKIIKIELFHIKQLTNKNNCVKIINVFREWKYQNWKGECTWSDVALLFWTLFDLLPAGRPSAMPRQTRHLSWQDLNERKGVVTCHGIQLVSSSLNCPYSKICGTPKRRERGRHETVYKWFRVVSFRARICQKAAMCNQAYVLGRALCDRRVVSESFQQHRLTCGGTVPHLPANAQMKSLGSQGRRLTGASYTRLGFLCCYENCI